MKRWFNQEISRLNILKPFTRNRGQPWLVSGKKGEGYRRKDAEKRGEMVPVKLFIEVKKREHSEYCQCDYFLNHLELEGRIDRVPPAIGGNLKAIFKKRNAPACKNDKQQWLIFEFQMSVPREGHENIRAGQHDHRQPAGLEQGVHNSFSALVEKSSSRK
jgi:hypothetical protein